MIYNVYIPFALLYIYVTLLTMILAKVKRDSSCSCGLSTVERTRIVNGAEAKVWNLIFIFIKRFGI